MKTNIVSLLLMAFIACQRHGVVATTEKNATINRTANGSSDLVTTGRKTLNNYNNFSKSVTDTSIYERTTLMAFNNPKYTNYKFTQKFDSSKSKSLIYTFQFFKQNQLISFFKPYFDSAICEPIDYKNITYKTYMRAAKQRATEMKEKFVVKLSKPSPPDNRELIERTFGSLKNFDKYRLVPFPLYKLSFNIILYNQDSTLNQYFTLDTTTFNYRVMNGDKLVTYLYCYRQGNYFDFDAMSSEVLKQQSFEYEYIKKKFRKDPVQFNLGLSFPRHPGFGINLKPGFIENGKMMLFEFSREDANNNNGKEGIYFFNNHSIKLVCDVLSMEDFYFTGGIYNVLMQIIKIAYESSLRTDKRQALYPELDKSK